ncbi:tautomerase family protein [Microlunatus soli]|uniref:Tautomerase enzyme n=1 Tax=Microlunatus soli TaxID=630515 RepID=A0A1H1T7D0_9ACTN|nr:tautomerase family protein [Microlunatus soli]SDS55876.1 Tautomerase enzyme [Microlunatus soli]
MPLIQIDLERELFDSSKEEISKAVHDAQLEVLNAPADDLFQVYRPHEPGEFVFSPTFGGVDRQHLLLIRITMVHMHPVAAKQKLYDAMTSRLAEVGVRPDDVLICIVENGFEDWFAGTAMKGE